MALDPIVSADIDDLRLEAAPVNPAWMRQGRPVARAAVSGARDGLACAFVWDRTAGTFDRRFGGDEWVHILEGEVTVDDGEGARTLAAGSVALFRAGTTARWHVPRYVRKFAVCRDAMPWPVSAAFALRRKLGRAAAKLAARLPAHATAGTAAGGFAGLPRKAIGTALAASGGLLLAAGDLVLDLGLVL